MALQTIGLGTSPNDGTGDSIRVAGDKINDNFVELYNLLGDGTTLGDATFTTLTTPTVTNSGTLALSATGANIITASTNGVERARIDSSGNVGIGTSSPSYLLHLNQNGDTQAWISATNSGTNSAGIAFENQGQRNWQIWADRTNDALQFGHNSRATVGMQLTSSGNVGIGTTAPRAPLHVQPAGGASDNFNVLVSQYRPNIVLEDISVSATDFQFFVDGNAFQIRSGDASTDTKLASEHMRITSTGGIGIGTTAPDGNLNVHRTAASSGWIINGQTAGISNDSGLYMDSSNNIEMAVRNGSGTLTAAVKSSGSTFFNGGNVGIGTTSPSGKLSIQADATSDVDLRIFSDIANTPRIYLGDTASQTQGAIGYYNSVDALFFQSNGSERMRIDSSGNVLIGTTTTGASKLVVADDSIQVNTAKTPASASATGTTGQIAWDASYIYVCTATNTWRRVAHGTW